MSDYQGNLDDKQVWQIITDLGKRFGDSTGTVGKNGSRTKLFQRIAWRRQHFHNLPEADPPLPDHMKDAQRFQSDMPRKTGDQLKRRLTQNHFKVRVEPMKKSAQQREWARQGEQFLQSTLTLAEQTLMDQPIQASLADGQIVDAYSVLHWSMADHVWPEIPEPEYLQPDEFEDLDEAARGDYEPAEEDSGKPTRRYKQTAKSQLDQRKWQKAVAGSVWWIEVLPGDTCMWDRDRSLAQGFDKFVVKREISLLNYLKDLRAERDKQDALSAHEVDPKLDSFGPRDAPGQWEPNQGDWGERVVLYQLWTRDEVYEVIASGTGAKNANAYKLVKCMKHAYGMPPFVIVPANINPGNDPVMRYQPALEGIYRTKTVYDRALTYGAVITEQNAIPYYYWKNTKTDEPYNGEDGQKLTFRKDSAMAEVAPPGYELAKLEMSIDPAFVQLIDFLKVQHDESKPDTGNAETSEGAQPWTVRLKQSDANVEPSQYLERQKDGLTIMARNMLYMHGLPADQGGFGEIAYAYLTTTGKGKKSTVDADNIVSLDPAWVKSLQVSVDISAVSGQERIAVVEHGRALLNDPLVPLTTRTFLEDYMGDEDPDDTMADYDAQQMFDTMVKPGLMKQEVAKRYGTQIALGPDGSFIDAQGQQVSPEEVLARNGVQVQAPPQQQPMGQPGMPGPGQPGMPPPQQGGGSPMMSFHSPQVVAPPLSTLNTPGTIPLSGVPG